MEVKDSLTVLFDKLQNMLRSETVIGEPIVVGNVTVIPVVSVSVGAGSGGGEGTDQKGNRGDGGGGMGGGKVSPIAVIIVKDDDASVVPVSGRGSFERIIELAPEIISQLKPKKDESKSEKDDSDTPDDNKF